MPANPALAIANSAAKVRVSDPMKMVKGVETWMGYGRCVSWLGYESYTTEN